MRSFQCQRCGQLVFFENTECLNCATPLGFAADHGELAPLEEAKYRRCRNARLAGCNWLVADDDPVDLCQSCRLTKTRTRNSDQPRDGTDESPEHNESPRRDQVQSTASANAVAESWFASLKQECIP
jgi:hypothetical protein